MCAFTHAKEPVLVSAERVPDTKINSVQTGISERLRIRRLYPATALILQCANPKPLYRVIFGAWATRLVSAIKEPFPHQIRKRLKCNARFEGGCRFSSQLQCIDVQRRLRSGQLLRHGECRQTVVVCLCTARTGRWILDLDFHKGKKLNQ